MDTNVCTPMPIYRVLLNSLVLLFLSFGTSVSAQQKCLPVNGLTFERVSDHELLAVRDGRNVAFILISKWRGSELVSLPTKLGTFRFFSQNLCVSGAENRLHIDGQLFYVENINKFAQVR